MKIMMIMLTIIKNYVDDNDNIDNDKQIMKIIMLIKIKRNDDNKKQSGVLVFTVHIFQDFVVFCHYYVIMWDSTQCETGAVKLYLQAHNLQDSLKIII
jgi:hypothetical protein